MLCALMMVWIDCCAERSLAFFFRLPTVGMAISIRIAMIAITISNSIRVKPLARAWRPARQRETLLFMGCTALVGMVSQRADSSVKMLQRIDVEWKWNAQRGSY